MIHLAIMKGEGEAKRDLTSLQEKEQGCEKAILIGGECEGRWVYGHFPKGKISGVRRPSSWGGEVGGEGGI